MLRYCRGKKDFLQGFIVLILWSSLSMSDFPKVIVSSGNLMKAVFFICNAIEPCDYVAGVFPQIDI